MFKMRLVDRILLAVYAVLGILFLVGGALYALLPPVRQWILAAGEWLFASWLGWALCALVALVLAAWSVRLIALAFRRERRPDRSSVALQKTENGAVRVSLAAMEALVKQAISHTEGVLEIRTGIVNHEDSITVRIDMVLSSNSHIPNVTMIMQRNVKRFIEEFSGIAVREVIIMVSGIRDGETPLLTAERARGVLVEPIEPIEALKDDSPPAEDAAQGAQILAPEPPAAEPAMDELAPEDSDAEGADEFEASETADEAQPEESAQAEEADPFARETEEDEEAAGDGRPAHEDDASWTDR